MDRGKRDRPVTVWFTSAEIRKLDELTSRSRTTRSTVVRYLVAKEPANRFRISGRRISFSETCKAAVA